MRDGEFEALLDQYLAPPAEPNAEMAGVEFDWVVDEEGFGMKHIWEKHRVTTNEVEEVILELPPIVSARRHRDFPDRTVFWGATRADRWLVVVCEDWVENETRYLRPITAFEPDEGEAYWKRL